MKFSNLQAILFATSNFISEKRLLNKGVDTNNLNEQVALQEKVGGAVHVGLLYDNKAGLQEYTASFKAYAVEDIKLREMKEVGNSSAEEIKKQEQVVALIENDTRDLIVKHNLTDIVRALGLREYERICVIQEVLANMDDLKPEEEALDLTSVPLRKVKELFLNMDTVKSIDPNAGVDWAELSKLVVSKRLQKKILKKHQKQVALINSDISKIRAKRALLSDLKVSLSEDSSDSAFESKQKAILKLEVEINDLSEKAEKKFQKLNEILRQISPDLVPLNVVKDIDVFVKKTLVPMLDGLENGNKTPAEVLDSLDRINPVVTQVREELYYKSLENTFESLTQKLNTQKLEPQKVMEILSEVAQKTQLSKNEFLQLINSSKLHNALYKRAEELPSALIAAQTGMKKKDFIVNLINNIVNCATEIKQNTPIKGAAFESLPVAKLSALFGKFDVAMLKIKDLAKKIEKAKQAGKSISPELSSGWKTAATVVVGVLAAFGFQAAIPDNVLADDLGDSIDSPDFDVDTAIQDLMAKVDNSKSLLTGATFADIYKIANTSVGQKGGDFQRVDSAELNKKTSVTSYFVSQRIREFYQGDVPVKDRLLFEGMFGQGGHTKNYLTEAQLMKLEQSSLSEPLKHFIFTGKEKSFDPREGEVALGGLSASMDLKGLTNQDAHAVAKMSYELLTADQMAGIQFNGKADINFENFDQTEWKAWVNAFKDFGNTQLNVTGFTQQDYVEKTVDGHKISDMISVHGVGVELDQKLNTALADGLTLVEVGAYGVYAVTPDGEKEQIGTRTETTATTYDKYKDYAKIFGSDSVEGGVSVVFAIGQNGKIKFAVGAKQVEYNEGSDELSATSNVEASFVLWQHGNKKLTIEGSDRRTYGEEESGSSKGALTLSHTFEGESFNTTIGVGPEVQYDRYTNGDDNLELTAAAKITFTERMKKAAKKLGNPQATLKAMWDKMNPAPQLKSTKFKDVTGTDLDANNRTKGKKISKLQTHVDLAGAPAGVSLDAQGRVEIDDAVNYASWVVTGGTVNNAISIEGGDLIVNPDLLPTLTQTITIVGTMADASTRTITIPVVAGSVHIDLSQITIVVGPGAEVAPIMGDAPNRTVTVNTAMTNIDLSSYVTLTNGDAITSYNLASGSLPAGVTLDTNTGLISGTPTATGTFNITVSATDNDGESNTDAITIQVDAALVVGAPTVDLAAASDSGVSDSDNITNLTSVEVNLTFPTNAVGCDISINGGTNWVNFGADTSPVIVLPVGTTSILARGYNADGVRGGVSVAEVVTVDQTAPTLVGYIGTTPNTQAVTYNNLIVRFSEAIANVTGISANNSAAFNIDGISGTDLQHDWTTPDLGIAVGGSLVTYANVTDLAGNSANIDQVVSPLFC